MSETQSYETSEGEDETTSQPYHPEGAMYTTNEFFEHIRNPSPLDSLN